MQHSPLRLGRMNVANFEYISGCLYFSIICLPIMCCSESNLIHTYTYTYTHTDISSQRHKRPGTYIDTYTHTDAHTPSLYLCLSNSLTHTHSHTQTLTDTRIFHLFSQYAECENVSGL